MGKNPPDAVRIRLHSNKAKLIGRVEFKDDRDGAFQLQRQFKLTTIGRPLIKPPPPFPCSTTGISRAWQFSTT